MFRREKWWIREIERINRAHEEERDRLIAAIAHLAGRPLPTGASEPPLVEEPPLEYLSRPESEPVN